MATRNLSVSKIVYQLTQSTPSSHVTSLYTADWTTAMAFAGLPAGDLQSLQSVLYTALQLVGMVADASRCELVTPMLRDHFAVGHLQSVLDGSHGTPQTSQKCSWLGWPHYSICHCTFQSHLGWPLPFHSLTLNQELNSAFTVAAPSSWNNLPFDLQMTASVSCLISTLKIFIFNTAFAS